MKCPLTLRGREGEGAFGDASLLKHRENIRNVGKWGEWKGEVGRINGFLG